MSNEFSALTDAALTEALAASGVLNPVTPSQVNRVVYLLVKQVHVSRVTARKVAEWITPQITWLTRVAGDAARQRDEAEAFIGENGLLCAFHAYLGEPATTGDQVESEPESLAEVEVTAEQDTFCRYEFGDGSLCAGAALPDSPFCHGHQDTDQPAAELLPAARPARRFRHGRVTPCTAL